MPSSFYIKKSQLNAGFLVLKLKYKVVTTYILAN